MLAKDVRRVVILVGLLALAGSGCAVYDPYYDGYGYRHGYGYAPTYGYSVGVGYYSSPRTHWSHRHHHDDDDRYDRRWRRDDRHDHDGWRWNRRWD